LEEGSREIFDGARERVFACEGFVETEDTDIFLSYRRCQSAFFRGQMCVIGEAIPADCCDFTRRVALSMQTTRTPVTMGSRVPE